MGLVTGFVAGLLGLGGGVILGPALLVLGDYVALSGKLSSIQATGVTAAQGVIGSLSSWFFHRKKVQSNQLAWVIGIPMGLGAVVSSLWIQSQAESVIPATFTCMLATAIVLSFFVGNNRTEFRTPSAGILIALSLPIGLLNGVIGQAGAFFFIPFFIYLVGMPVSLVVGSAGLIGLMSVSSALVPRLLSGVIPWDMVLVIAPAVILGGKLGAKVHYKVSESVVHLSIRAVLILSLIQLLFKTGCV